MKLIALFTLVLSFSVFASRDVPCEEGQNICKSRTWREALTFKSKTIFSRGVGLTYASAQDQAWDRIYSTYKGISCGIGIPVDVESNQIRLRDGRMAIEVWSACYPPREVRTRGTPRQGVCIGCGTGRGGVIIR